MGSNATKTIPQILKDNICTVFNLLNFLIAVALAAVGAWKNILFFLVIVINTVIGIVQEIKAKKQVERLTLLTQPRVKVLRRGQSMELSPDDVLTGDELEPESGDVICTDCIIAEGRVEMNESILTGESEAVEKSVGDTLFAGSTVIAGRCRAEALCDSGESASAKMIEEVKGQSQAPSELFQSMNKVTKFTSFFIVPLGIVLFLQAYLGRGNAMDVSVISTAAGLLGMLPKGLVLLISIGLAAGVIRLAKNNVLVRDLHSLENLAHCDTICLDKTGTLTEGTLEVESVFLDDDRRDFESLMASYLQNTTDNNGTYRALKAHFFGEHPFPVKETIPFSSERKWSAVTLENGDTFVLGAPEKLCKEIPEEVQALLAKGKRLLFAGVCRGDVAAENIELLGMIVIGDKLRKNARETIGYFYDQGIDIKIISGDSPLAASVVAEMAGVQQSDLYIDMSTVKDDAIPNIAAWYTVFGRVTPRQKQLLIAALQKSGRKVAMTGDGVNDLLAMRQADCSAAMGNGSDAAKQTAQLVLVDDDFSVLRDVIAEGRRVVNNLTKSAGVFFIKTIYSILLSILCLIFNVGFPFIPIQITLIDAVIEGFPAFFMSFERNDKKVEGTFLNSAIRAALPNAIAISICCLLMFWAGPAFGIDTAQSSLIMYLTVGIVSLAGVVKASLPLNLLRGFLASASIVGFIAAAAIFAPLLQLPALTATGSLLLTFSLIVGLIIALLLKIPQRHHALGGEIHGNH